MLSIPLVMPSILSERDGSMQVVMRVAANWIGLSTVTAADVNGDGDPPYAKRERAKSAPV